jgi:hypothetical protein
MISQKTIGQKQQTEESKQMRFYSFVYFKHVFGVFTGFLQLLGNLIIFKLIFLKKLIKILKLKIP